MNGWDMLVGSLFSLAISYGGYRAHSLTKSGAAAAFFVGCSIFLGFCWIGFLLLGAFFVSSSLLSKFKREKKKSVEQLLAKSDKRDYVQVLANGGVPAVISIFQVMAPSHIWFFLFSISLAAANSDTWASEVGTLSKGNPRMMFTLKQVERGTSGAVSLLGTLAGLSGSFFIAILALIVTDITVLAFVLIMVFGFAGNLIDTIIGGILQVKYLCSSCKKVTENPVHCKVHGRKISGISIFNNDVVNFVSIVAAVIIGFGFSFKV
ncbi:DUF92 domain-containing protein [Metabacillus arenae]|uniref:DUF92 domain-containing protein n=1 Tax=Metabacillus arenae TaxID=2771434 RepID=A0A926RVI7_9BACI|nr:DUF92 domain-containing protein [Metabacillus arenae]MBD1378886.1 DUF92 domain-containing protein [Metabacillus arenae]